MDRSVISNWVRQARHRAKKNKNIYNDLPLEDVEHLVAEHNNLCVYCDSAAETLDHAFPLKDNAPNAPANVLPVCRSCKSLKGTNDLVSMYRSNHISKQRYICVLEEMMSRKGSDVLKEYVRKITGIE